MLILKAYANFDLIGEIHIQNIGRHEGDWFEYRIRKPEGHDKPVFLHRRSSGWMPLAEKVLHYLKKVRPMMEVRPTEMGDIDFLGLMGNKKKFGKAIKKQVMDALMEYAEADMEIENDKILYGDPNAEPPKGILLGGDLIEYETPKKQTQKVQTRLDKGRMARIQGKGRKPQ
jgi:hypothetical protein